MDWRQILESKRVSFEPVQYPSPLATVREVAEFEGIEESQVGKCMGIRIAGNPAVLLIRGDRQVDLESLGSILGETVGLLTPREVEGVFGVVAGALTPIVAANGSCRLFIDNSILETPQISISSGDPSMGVRISGEDATRLGPFSVTVDLSRSAGQTPGTIEPRVLKGFRDYLPEEMRRREAMIVAITELFRMAGFEPLATPALEYSDILLGKYGLDAEKLLYRFKDNGGRDVCLRYDLTVPLARVAAQYPLAQPFKRYQVAPVWRAEKPGQGRFREFVQCDADIVGSSSLVYDAECAALAASTMTALEVGGFEVRLSTRKLLAALGVALGIADDDRLKLVFRIIDKLPSRGLKVVQELLVDKAGCSSKQVDLISSFITVEGDNEEKLTAAADLIGPPAEVAVAELDTVLKWAARLHGSAEPFVLDFSIARGLDYYTGTVYETFLGDLGGLGSVMSGGRYDELISRFLGRPLPAVGISVGVDRLYSGLCQIRAERGATDLHIPLVVYDASCVDYALGVLRTLRQAGLCSELLLDSDEFVGFKSQMKSANRKGASHVLLLGPDEIGSDTVVLKDMIAGTQQTLPSGELVSSLLKLQGPPPTKA